VNKAQLVEAISNQTALAKKTFRETVDAVTSITGRKEVE
jgi:nucleoid DNA-binding protein